jgi:alkylation response protein AidB-like acyl-CoA dehydrogenase
MNDAEIREPLPSVTVPFPPALTRLPPAAQSWRQEVRQLAEDRIRPLVTAMDEAAEMSPALIAELFSRRLMAIETPRDLGGRGGSFFDVVLAVEEIARVDPAVAVLVHVQNSLVANALMRWASPEQRRRYLPALASGTVGAYAMSERGAGSDVFSLSTTAAPSADGYVLDGRKMWASSAAEAGLFVVFATTAPGQGAQGIAAFLVERDSPGFQVGKREPKLGVRASSTCELILEQVRVPAASVLAGPGAGNRIAVETLNEGRIGIAAQMVGLAQGALESALAYCQTRRQFGQPIAAFQAVQFQLAEMATRVEAARLLVYNAARLRAGEATPAERFRAPAMAKYFASQVAEEVASQAIDLFGGNGYLKEFPVEKLYRDAKVGKLYEGTSNMQLRTIAATLLQPA